MLKSFMTGWRRRLTGAEIEEQVEEELRFHHEMLAEEFEERGLPEEAAKAAAAGRFGNLERVQSQCVEIKRRSRPAVKLLKLLLLLSFVTGVWVRASATVIQFVQLGDVLMATAVLGQLLLYVRGLRATASLSVRREPPVSLFGRGEASSIEAYDELGRTPVERLVADKAHKDS